MTKQVKPSVWKLLLVTAAILMAAALLLGATPESRPQFVASAQTLNPDPYKAVKPSPVVIQRTVQAEQSEAPVASPEPVQSPGGQGLMAGFEQCTSYVCRTSGICQNGVAGSWVPSSSVPSVGAVMIWAPGEQGAGSVGHVGVVVGINGSTVTVRHSNWGGGQTTFSSTGKFVR